MDIVIFDIWADYGHFKMPYTTTSPMTLPVPPKTTVYGIISAILGFDKHSYLENFQNEICKIAIALKSPYKKTYITENLINSKKEVGVKLFSRYENKPGVNPHTQIKIEFLKDAKFRLYITHENSDILNALNDYLKNHKSKYTVSLGLSECLANFEYIGHFNATPNMKTDKFVEINSILPLNTLTSKNDLNILVENRKYLKSRLPLEFSTKRELLKSGDFIFEVSGFTIKARPEIYYSIIKLNENIILF